METQSQNLQPYLSYSQTPHISMTAAPFMEVNKKITSSIAVILQMGILKPCDIKS